jgi:hypothetical protein
VPRFPLARSDHGTNGRPSSEAEQERDREREEAGEPLWWQQNGAEHAKRQGGDSGGEPCFRDVHDTRFVHRGSSEIGAFLAADATRGVHRVEETDVFVAAAHRSSVSVSG